MQSFKDKISGLVLKDTLDESDISKAALVEAYLRRGHILHPDEAGRLRKYIEGQSITALSTERLLTTEQTAGVLFRCFRQLYLAGDRRVYQGKVMSEAPENSYEAWISMYRSRVPSTYGKCKEATAEMKAVFKELDIVRGHVWCAWGQRSHFWCVDPKGNIVDPTADQFPGGVGEYMPWKPGDAVRVGKCMNCGDEIWRPVRTLDEEPQHASVCSEECEQKLRADFDAEREQYLQKARST